MRVSLLLALVAASLVAAQRQNTQWCKIPFPHGQSIDLTKILPARYNATMVGVSGVTPVAVNFGWCWTVNSTTCNTTVNQAMYITSTSPALSPCTSSFGAFLGPIQNTTASSVTFQIWDTQAGATHTVNVLCDPSGANGTATLVGQIVNTPVWQYTSTWTSVHACVQ